MSSPLPFGFIARRSHSTPRTQIHEPPPGHVRVAIFTPAGALSHVKCGEPLGGRVLVSVFGERLQADPCAPIREAGSGVRYRVTMPLWAPSEG